MRKFVVTEFVKTCNEILVPKDQTSDFSVKLFMFSNVSGAIHLSGNLVELFFWKEKRQFQFQVSRNVFLMSSASHQFGHVEF